LGRVYGAEGDKGAAWAYQGSLGTWGRHPEEGGARGQQMAAWGSVNQPGNPNGVILAPED